MLSSGLFIRISRTPRLLKPAMFSGVAGEDGQLTPIGALNDVAQCALQVDDRLMRSGGKNTKKGQKLNKNQMF